MSDTPRTDYVWARVDPQVSEWEDAITLREHANQLERELASAEARLQSALQDAQRKRCSAIEQDEVGNPCSFYVELMKRAESAEARLRKAEKD